MIQKSSRLSISCCCASRGSRSHTSSGPKGLLSRNVPPGLAYVQNLHLLEQAELVAGDEVGFIDQVRRVDRFGSEPQV